MKHSLIRGSNPNKLKVISLITIAGLMFTSGCDNANEDEAASSTPIVALAISCSTATDAACTSAGNNGDQVVGAYLAPGQTCADVSGTVSVAAQKMGSMSCDGTTCTATVSGGTGWTDDLDVAVSTLPVRAYSIALIFDFNNNFIAAGGPDTGDVLCCVDNYELHTSDITLAEDGTGVSCSTL